MLAFWKTYATAGDIICTSSSHVDLQTCSTVRICCRSVVIKGEPSAEAVLCTAQSTYAVKIVETTNSLLLVPPAQV